MTYSIFAWEAGADREIELCRVGSNPDQVVKALKEKTQYSRALRKRVRRYLSVRVVEKKEVPPTETSP
jgi:hypothetical protein